MITGGVIPSGWRKGGYFVASPVPYDTVRTGIPAIKNAAGMSGLPPFGLRGKHRKVLFEPSAGAIDLATFSIIPVLTVVQSIRVKDLSTKLCLCLLHQPRQMQHTLQANAIPPCATIPPLK